MIDKTLINALSEMTREAKRIKRFKDRLRIKGEIVKKGKTKNDNIRLKIKEKNDLFNYIVLKSHKERYALAEKLKIGEFVSAVGIRKYRAVICTQLKQIYNIDNSNQQALPSYDNPA